MVRACHRRGRFRSVRMYARVAAMALIPVACATAPVDMTQVPSGALAEAYLDTVKMETLLAFAAVGGTLRRADDGSLIANPTTAAARTSQNEARRSGSAQEIERRGYPSISGHYSALATSQCGPHFSDDPYRSARKASRSRCSRASPSIGASSRSLPLWYRTTGNTYGGEQRSKATRSGFGTDSAS